MAKPKHVVISEKIHRKLGLIKLYADIDMSEIASRLLEEAFNSPLLEKVLMKILADPKKVNYLINRLNNQSIK